MPRSDSVRAGQWPGKLTFHLEVERLVNICRSAVLVDFR